MALTRQKLKRMGGPGSIDLKKYMDEMHTAIVEMQDKLDELAQAFTDHVHVENVAAAYTQNASTNATAIGVTATAKPLPELG
jgi:hypothetical protein